MIVERLKGVCRASMVVCVCVGVRICACVYVSVRLFRQVAVHPC